MIFSSERMVANDNRKNVPKRFCSIPKRLGLLNYISPAFRRGVKLSGVNDSFVIDGKRYWFINDLVYTKKKRVPTELRKAFLGKLILGKYSRRDAEPEPEPFPDGEGSKSNPIVIDELMNE